MTPAQAPARGFRVGDRVALPGEDGKPWGEVATFQDLGDRQILRVKDDAGQLHAVVVERGDATGEIVAGPIDLDQARAVAREALSPGGSRVPVSRQVNLLAAAVLLLCDRRTV